MGSFRRNSSLACLPSLQLTAAAEFLRPATMSLCSASLHQCFAVRNSSQPFLNHTNSWHSAVSCMSCIERLPSTNHEQSSLGLFRSQCLLFASAGPKCRGDAVTCLEMLPIMIPARAAKHAPFSGI